MSLESKRQQLADFNLKASSDNDAKKRLTALFRSGYFCGNGCVCNGK